MHDSCRPVYIDESIGDGLMGPRVPGVRALGQERVSWPWNNIKFIPQRKARQKSKQKTKSMPRPAV